MLACGFTENNFLGCEERFVLYERVAESLNQINQSGIEIIIQTMPPFPWHFGGQRYHNLFVDADEIRDFCEKYKYRICFDISHSMMACNYYGWNLSDFTKKIATYNAHLHIVDAKGIDGEGIQIGEGDVNFKKIALELNNLCPKISFVPEVWQGHKNKGHGFWHALSYLENTSMKIKDLKILVTGGAGFIGSHLCEQLVNLRAKKIISLDNYFTGSKSNHVHGYNTYLVQQLILKT